MGAGRMSQDTVRAPNSDGEDRGFDLIHRLSRVENMIEEITRSQAWPSQSGATGMLPRRKVKRERLRRANRSRWSEPESDANFDDLIAMRKQGKCERLRRLISGTRKREYKEDSDWDSEEQEFQEEKEGTDDFTNNEKEFFTGHTDTSWIALARTAITTKGRRDSPEASRAIEILQPAIESGFEAAKAIAALAASELRKTHIEEEEKERLRGLFCAYALITDCISRINLLKVKLQSGWESAKGFFEG
ncbi:uncharacterized protein MONOS_7944 [Monocercomonoides exilis]|uniref:uncharacterized protein n=1 Tax=Monocercomonoides exilis TaxID=2049356 RepID=UPI00355AA00C|nr:hypothetical protein MONOS_7944 [Monocercomonoides exilis]|eukprot:MONOS_7944.1-p1 / transcript=MONOS_7944.1 / gene=MONOS_7944 / organism=Monocercomonoides_exilis_PA203 / gene_product=unspecified product / transcript_product=unspecified product / location=Mono_scaffold00286:49870-50786(+) / protein_length=247 / sequence_SO=supercontig / SO=protein_coding / is_pseudo=false